jgi:hypothetical protein
MIMWWWGVGERKKREEATVNDERGKKDNKAGGICDGSNSSV